MFLLFANIKIREEEKDFVEQILNEISVTYV